jgi:hypothetical protein
MKIYNRYILTVALFLLLTTVVLIAAGQNLLANYYTIYVVEALIITELYVHFNSRASSSLNLVSILLFGGLMVALIFQVVLIVR